MQLWLAPMEGVVDHIMRDFLTRIGGIDQCVTEFIRVTDRLLPDSVFYRYCPELKNKAQTSAKIPVTVQLLGGHAEPLLENALRLVQLGAKGIDLNFGCPAKTVNRHDGGATLLKSPERLFKIVDTLRKNLPPQIPVSAKMRLGFEDPGVCIENAQALASANASWLTIHCRTKVQMYTPPAYWEWIAKIKQQVQIPIIANGDIWNANDLERCREVTDCEDFMIGRGALRDPLIFLKIKKQMQESEAFPKQEILRFFSHNSSLMSPHFAQARTKQWLRNMVPQSLELAQAFDQLKVINDPQFFSSEMQRLFT
jgi:tRNA-dihydrouridine synthase C